MYAAAGGASLASRQARRVKQRQHHTNDNMHQQFHRRFQQLQHQHAPACAEGYHYMRMSSGALLSPSQMPSCAQLNQQPITAFSTPDAIQGKTGWMDKEKRSIQGTSYPGPGQLTPGQLQQLAQHKLKIAETQKKWSKKNKIQDSLLGGEDSCDEVRRGLHKEYDAAANMLLYIGLCAVALGLVIAFVGTGEKGFKTVELRLIGPTMIGCGLFCCFLRIALCFCPTRCMKRCFKRRSYKNRLNENDRRTLEYYKHLPFRPDLSRNTMFLFNKATNCQNDNNQKQVSILMNKRNHPDIIDDAISDNISTLKDISAQHADLIDLKNSFTSLDNLPSLDSSLEYLNQQLNDDYDIVKPNIVTEMSEEQLLRLKSTLTFRDSNEHFSHHLMCSYEEFDLNEIKTDELNHKFDINTKTPELVLNPDGLPI